MTRQHILFSLGELGRVCEPRDWVSRPSWIRLPLLMMVLASLVACGDSGALADSDSHAQQSGSEKFQKEIERVRTLVLPMQKRWAREFIKKDRDSPEAKVAQELLDEYELYENQAAVYRSLERKRSRSVNAYWNSRRLPASAVVGKSIHITNLTNVPVIYQIKGPSMEWAGPHSLGEGQTHQYRYPALYRRIIPGGARIYSLRLGGRYVFHPHGSVGLPGLFRGQ